MMQYYMIGGAVLGVATLLYQRRYKDVQKRINDAPKEISRITKYDKYFKEYGDEYSIDPMLLKSMAYWESGLNPNKTSWVGAQGIAQFIPSTWDWVWESIIKSTPPSVFNPAASIRAMAAYMRYLLNIFNNNIIHALLAYNYGPTRFKNEILPKYGHDIKLVLGKVGSEAAYYATAIPHIYDITKTIGITV